MSTLIRPDRSHRVGLQLRSVPEETDVLSLRPAQRRVRAGFTYQITGTVSGANEVKPWPKPDTDYPLWVSETFLQLPEYDEEAIGQLDLRSLVQTIARSFNLGPDPMRDDNGYNPYAIAVRHRGVPALRAGDRARTTAGSSATTTARPVPLYPLTTEIDLPPAKSDAVYWFLFENTDDGLTDRWLLRLSRFVDGGPTAGRGRCPLVLRRDSCSASTTLTTGLRTTSSANTMPTRGSRCISPTTAGSTLTPHRAHPQTRHWRQSPAASAAAGESPRNALSTPRFDLRPGVGGETSLADVVLDDILQYLAAGHAYPADHGRSLRQWHRTSGYWLGTHDRRSADGLPCTIGPDLAELAVSRCAVLIRPLDSGFRLLEIGSLDRSAAPIRQRPLRSTHVKSTPCSDSVRSRTRFGQSLHGDSVWPQDPQ